MKERSMSVLLKFFYMHTNHLGIVLKYMFYTACLSKGLGSAFLASSQVRLMLFFKEF